MDNLTNTTKLGESLKILARKECFIDGVTQIINVNQGEFYCKLDGINLIIKGNNIHINKLDLDKKYVQLTGDFNQIKYTNSIKNNIKKIFGK